MPIAAEHALGMELANSAASEPSNQWAPLRQWVPSCDKGESVASGSIGSAEPFSLKKLRNLTSERIQEALELQRPPVYQLDTRTRGNPEEGDPVRIGGLRDEVVVVFLDSGNTIIFPHERRCVGITLHDLVAEDALLATVLMNHEATGIAGIANTLQFVPRRESPCDRFRSELLLSLHDEPVEDCVSHAAEDILRTVLAEHDVEGVCWIARFLKELSSVRRVRDVAGIVQCLGRLGPTFVPSKGEDVIRDSLRNSNAAVRKAAVCAIEHWATPSLLEALRGHHDDVSWLDRYAHEVVAAVSQSKRLRERHDSPRPQI